MKKPGKCRFYNGTVNETCEAGVNYRQLAGEPEFGWGTRLPCLAKYATGPDVAKCTKREEPTPEEIAESEAELKKSMEQFNLALPLVASMKKKYKGQSASEIVECPVCKGKLHLTIAASNGHVWGKCLTLNCLSWIE